MKQVEVYTLVVFPVYLTEASKISRKHAGPEEIDI